MVDQLGPLVDKFQRHQRLEYLDDRHFIPFVVLCLATRYSFKKNQPVAFWFFPTLDNLRYITLCMVTPHWLVFSIRPNLVLQLSIQAFRRPIRPFGAMVQPCYQLKQKRKDTRHEPAEIIGGHLLAGEKEGAINKKQNGIILRLKIIWNYVRLQRASKRLMPKSLAYRRMCIA